MIHGGIRESEKIDDIRGDGLNTAPMWALILALILLGGLAFVGYSRVWPFISDKYADGSSENAYWLRLGWISAYALVTTLVCLLMIKPWIQRKLEGPDEFEGNN